MLTDGKLGIAFFKTRMISKEFLKNVKWTRKDLTNLQSLSIDELEEIFSLAELFKESVLGGEGKLDYLHGKTIVNLFLEPSTRTRTAFEMAAHRLGAHVITITSSASSIVKGETLRDTAKNIEALTTDMIIVRHSAAGAADYLASRLSIPVINAGDGAHAHPTQGLLDTFTLREHFGKDLRGIKITILGDVLFSRVARSDIQVLKKYGAEITVSGPATLVPPSVADAFGVKVSYNLRDAVKDADAVILLRIQHERQDMAYFPSIAEYANIFGLNEMREDWLKKDAIIMHPGPINREVELDSSLADSARSVILRQVTNGVAVRMAVINLCMAAKNKASI